MTTTDQQPGAEVALPSQQPQNAPLTQQIVRMQDQFGMAAPRGIDPQQIVRDALTAVRNTPKLIQCEPLSVLGGLMTMAQLGLRVGVLGHGWVLPFWNHRARQFEAQLVIGYQGFITLAYRSQMIDRITARTVHANDVFDLEYGLNERLVHQPAPGERGAPAGYYATVKIRGAGDPMFHYMTHPEVELYRDRYAMAKKKDGTIVGPWRDDFESMAKKTQIRQLSKFMPKGTDLAVALAVDDGVRVDVSPNADPVHVSHHIERDAAPETTHVDVDDIDVEDPPTDEAR